jgi:hypothetical protein
MVNDRDAFLQLCASYLATKPHVRDNDCKRKGKKGPGKLRRLLVRFRSEATAAEQLHTAPLLRRADQVAIAGITPDLSPSEAKLAYEETKLKRDKKTQTAAFAVTGAVTAKAAVDGAGNQSSDGTAETFSAFTALVASNSAPPSTDSASPFQQRKAGNARVNSSEYTSVCAVLC